MPIDRGTSHGERMVRAVSRATSVATASLDPADIQDAAVEALVQFFIARRADLWRMEDGRLAWTSGSGAGENDHAPADVPLLVDRIARGGLAQCISLDEMQDEGWRQWRELLFSLDCRELGVYALTSGDDSLGCITVAIPEGGHSTLDALSLFAEQVASALEKAQLHARARDAAALTELQNRLLTELADCREVTELRRVLSQHASHVDQDVHIAIASIDRAGRATVFGNGHSLGMRLARVEERELLLKAARCDQPMEIGTCPPLEVAELGLAGSEGGTRALYGSGLIVGDRKVGCLVASLPEDRPDGVEALQDFLRAAGPAVTIGLENALMFSRESDRSQRLAEANELARTVSTVTSDEELFEKLAPGVQRLFGCCRVAVYAYEQHGLRAMSAAGTTSASPRQEQQLVQAAAERLRARRAELQDVDCHAVPLVARASVYGVLYAELPEGSLGLLDDADFALLESVADQAAGTLSVIAAAEQIERNYKETIQALVSALEASDQYTADHANDVADWAVEVGKHLGLSDVELRDLELGAIFHDIGKIAIPNEILNKPGRLTDEEFEIMKTHTIAGEKIIAPIEFLQNVRPMVRHEHERWDGKGYPDGIAGSAIPLGSRIIFVCDAYHAITSDRPYRKAQSHEFARKILVDNAGSQFDPAVVSVFLDVIERQRSTNGQSPVVGYMPAPGELPSTNADAGSATTPLVAEPADEDAAAA